MALRGAGAALRRTCWGLGKVASGEKRRLGAGLAAARAVAPTLTCPPVQCRWKRSHRGPALDRVRALRQLQASEEGAKLADLGVKSSGEDRSMPWGGNPSLGLVSEGDFELAPYADPYSKTHPDGSANIEVALRILNSKIRNTGLLKTENQRRRPGRHVKPTTKRRQQRRRAKYMREQKAMRRVLWLIEQERNHEKFMKGRVVMEKDEAFERHEFLYNRMHGYHQDDN